MLHNTVYETNYLENVTLIMKDFMGECYKILWLNNCYCPTLGSQASLRENLTRVNRKKLAVAALGLETNT